MSWCYSSELPFPRVRPLSSAGHGAAFQLMPCRPFACCALHQPVTWLPSCPPHRSLLRKAFPVCLAGEATLTHTPCSFVFPHSTHHPDIIRDIWFPVCLTHQTGPSLGQGPQQPLSVYVGVGGTALRVSYSPPRAGDLPVTFTFGGGGIGEGNSLCGEP